MAVSLQQVAEKSGVTGAAVSMALRGNPRISIARRNQIRAIADELGYKPNILARGLAGGSTRSIGILVSGLCNGAPSATMEIARGLVGTAMNKGYVGSIADSMGGLGVIIQTLQDFKARGFDGVFFQNGDYKPTEESVIVLLKQFKSVVVMTNRTENLPFDQVVHDRELAIQSAVEHLVKSGRRFPVLAGVYRPKAEIYIRYFKRCGINVRPEAVLEPVRGNGRIFCKVLEEQLVARKLLFDCLICNNDCGATVALSWLRSKNISVPKDAAVIGFDNNDSSNYILPPLASIERESEQVTKILSRLLFERIEQPALPPRCEVVPMRFVHRESAG